MTFLLSDCLPVFNDHPENDLDAIVDDPPAGIGFMGRSWDKDRGGRVKWVAWLAERKAAQLRASKPGAYSLTWALPRTSHWTATALEDAGWRIRDVITHHFGQGWPKGEAQLKPSSEHWILAQKPFEKGLTARANVERYGVGVLGIDACRVERGTRPLMVASTPERRVGVGGFDLRGKSQNGSTDLGSWPTNLILSHAPGCEERGTRVVRGSAPASGPTLTGESSSRARGKFNGTEATLSYGTEQELPACDCLASCFCGASVLHSSGGQAPRCDACGRGMEWTCPVAEMDAQSGDCRSGIAVTRNGGGNKIWGSPNRMGLVPDSGYTDEGGASRFFPTFHYASKASPTERDAGCEHLLWKVNKRHPFGFERMSLEEWRSLGPQLRATGNVHPTVKGFKSLEWLLNLVLPAIPGYTAKRKIGDGFTGSGSIPIQAWRMGHEFIATDVSPEAVEIARARLHYWQGGLHVQERAEPRPKTRKPALASKAAQQPEVPEQTKIPGA